MKSVHYLLLIFSAFLISVLQSCKKDPPAPDLPTLGTLSVQTVTANSVTLELPVISEGSRPIRLYGFFVSKTHPTPTALQSDNQSNGKINGTTFPTNLRSEPINQLTPNTRYYARAYVAMDELGEEIIYSETIQFTTDQVTVAPNFSDPQAWQVRATNLEIRYDLHNAGSSPLTEAGVVYSTSRAPQSITDGTKVRFTSPAQVGRFRHTLTSLSPSTVYYIRGYVTSATGTVLSSGTLTVRTHQNVANASIFFQIFQETTLNNTNMGFRFGQTMGGDQREKLVFVTPLRMGNSEFNNNPAVVQITPGTFYWQLINTNDTEIVRSGQWFNILYVNPGPRTAVVRVNLSAARLYVDHPLLNDTPTARMLIMPRWDDQVLTYRIKKPVMVAYDYTRKQWYICHNDSSLLPFGAKFNVLVDDRIIRTEVETDRLEGTNKNILRIDTENDNNAGRYCWTTAFLGDGYSFNNYVGVGPAQNNRPGIYNLSNHQWGAKISFFALFDL